MQSLLLIISFIGFIACLKFPEQIDAKFKELVRIIIDKLQYKPEISRDFLQLMLVSRVLSSLRAGISLDGSLEEAAQDPSILPAIKFQIKNLLSGKPDKDFLSQFFHAALETGISCISGLQSLQGIYRVKIKMRRKINAASAQARAQAEVLSWLPWIMALLVCVMDSGWFCMAVKNPITWILWAISFLLTAAGKLWINKTLERSLSPRNKTEEMIESSFPDLLIQVIAGIAFGKDSQSAVDLALSNSNDSLLKKQFLSSQNPEEIQHFKSILQQSNKGASGIREDLMALLQDLYTTLELKWEERAQQIPIQLMAPLFLCFFPSTLLVIGGLLIASMENLL